MLLISFLIASSGITFLSTVESVNPGLKIRASSEGMNYAAQRALDSLSSKMVGPSMPDRSGRADVAVCNVKYTVSDTKIEEFTGAISSVTVQPGSGLNWSVRGANVAVGGAIRYHCWLARDHVRFRIYTGDISVSLDLTMGRDSTGHPTVGITQCWAHIDSLDVDFVGGASWLYNLLEDILSDSVRSFLEDLLCEAARSTINKDVNRKLADLELDFTTDDQWFLNYGLVAQPVFGVDYLESSHRGEFYYGSNRDEAPFQPYPFDSPPTTTNKMLTFWISEYVLNTAGFVLQRQNILSVNISRKLFPNGNDFLSTNISCVPTCFGKLFQNIAKSFPNSSVEIVTKTTSAPALKISPESITGTFDGTMTYYVRLANESLLYLFNTKVSATVDVTVSLTNASFTGKILKLIPVVSVIDSKVGPVSTNILKLIINFAVNGFVKPKLNEAGQKGIVIPRLRNLQYTNTELFALPHAFCISTDAVYKI